MHFLGINNTQGEEDSTMERLAYALRIGANVRCWPNGVQITSDNYFDSFAVPIVKGAPLTVTRIDRATNTITLQSN